MRVILIILVLALGSCKASKNSCDAYGGHSIVKKKK
jgi:hypothetical protein